jgi:hypothetical protein
MALHIYVQIHLTIIFKCLIQFIDHGCGGSCGGQYWRARTCHSCTRRGLRSVRFCDSFETICSKALAVHHFVFSQRKTKIKLYDLSRYEPDVKHQVEERRKPLIAQTGWTCVGCMKIGSCSRVLIAGSNKKTKLCSNYCTPCSS